SIHVLAQELLELLSERDQLRVCRCRRRKLAHCRAVLSLGRPVCAGRSIPVPARDLFLFPGFELVDECSEGAGVSRRGAPSRPRTSGFPYPPRQQLAPTPAQPSL